MDNQDRRGIEEYLILPIFKDTNIGELGTYDSYSKHIKEICQTGNFFMAFFFIVISAMVTSAFWRGSIDAAQWFTSFFPNFIIYIGYIAGLHAFLSYSEQHWFPIKHINNIQKGRAWHMRCISENTFRKGQFALIIAAIAAIGMSVYFRIVISILIFGICIWLIFVKLTTQKKHSNWYYVVFSGLMLLAHGLFPLELGSGIPFGIAIGSFIVSTVILNFVMYRGGING